MDTLDSCLKGSDTVAIAGHIRPDGDCVGACLAAYNYVTALCAHSKVSLYMDRIPEKFRFLTGADRAEGLPRAGGADEAADHGGKNAAGTDEDTEAAGPYDLFIALDCADEGRLGGAARYLRTAKKTLSIDHHISNTHFAHINCLKADASSTCELLFELMDEKKITRDIAECLYVGIVCDTGVFRYGCTSPETMGIAGKLMAYGIPYPHIIDEIFDMRSFPQTRIRGFAFEKSRLYLDGRVIYSCIKKKHMEKYRVSYAELEGIVSQLRLCRGVEVAVLLTERAGGGYKISLRSASYVDVAKIAASFGGGGHVRAAGAMAPGKAGQVRERLLSLIEREIEGGSKKDTDDSRDH